MNRKTYCEYKNLIGPICDKLGAEQGAFLENI
jgi:hypothetical protein